MRKQFKKVLSMVLSAAMVLTLGSGAELKSASAEGETYTIAGEFDTKISSNMGTVPGAEDWSWDDVATGKTSFTGDTATINLKYEGSFPGADAVVGGNLVFCVDVVGLGAAIPSGTAVELSDIGIKVDGKDFAVDKAKVLTGDIEGKGNYRLEIYNCWGAGTAANPPISLADFKYDTSLEVSATLKAVKAPDPTPTPEPTEAPTARPTRDPAVTQGPRPETVTTGTPDEMLTSDGIHAYLFYQTDAWDCRNAYEDLMMNEQYGPNFVKAQGTEYYYPDEVFDIVDVKLDHDGEYTVSISGDDFDLSAAGIFNMLGVSTDLNYDTYPDVTVTMKNLKVDGNIVEGSEDVDLPNGGEKGYYTFFACSHWAGDELAPIMPFPKDGEDAIPMAEKSLSITFEISGLEEALMDIDAGIYEQPDNGTTQKPAKPEPTPSAPAPSAPAPSAPAPSASAPAPSASAPATDTQVGPNVGATVTVGSFKLKVTKAATTKSAGTATVTGLSKSGKKAKKLNVKDSMKSGNASYTVNAIGKNAFKGAKATGITLNKSITKIPASAFANCKKLKTLTLKAKLKSVAKKSFKGCKNKITVKGTGKKANVKLLKKSGYKKFK